MDDFLATGGVNETSTQPRSKMYSDSLTEAGRQQRGKTLLERTTVMRLHPNSDEERRYGSNRDGRRRVRKSQRSLADRFESDSDSGTARRHAKEDRPQKTREELDDELDAFLKGN